MNLDNLFYKIPPIKNTQYIYFLLNKLNILKWAPQTVEQNMCAGGGLVGRIPSNSTNTGESRDCSQPYLSHFHVCKILELNHYGLKVRGI